MTKIKIDFKGLEDYEGKLYKPVWKKLITAGRAHEGLRAEWRQQLTELQEDIGFEYIRFHGIFHDDMMVYNQKENGDVWYNWTYVDSVLDFILSIGIRPIVELGFVPNDLASGSDTIFWWKGNKTPPNDEGKWADLIDRFIRHCMNRYGKREVLNWYFELWNEANTKHFWTGTQEEYFRLYQVTVHTIKAIDKNLKVGGPATSSADQADKPWVSPWIEDFIVFCDANRLPVDFISTHPYPNTFPLLTDGEKQCYKDENGTYDALVWLKDTVANSKYKDAEIHITEWNSSPSPRDLVHDTAFMAPFLIKNNLQAIGLVDSLGFWAFTDIFEENGAAESMFHGGFGLINQLGLKKPAYYGYYFLNKLGNEILEQGDDFIVTRKDNDIQILMWNYCHYNDEFCNGDSSKLLHHDRYAIFEDKNELEFDLNLRNLDGKYRIIKYTLDRDNGSVYDQWLKNGANEEPDLEEINILKTYMNPTGTIGFVDGQSSYCESIKIKVHGVVFVEIKQIY